MERLGTQTVRIVRAGPDRRQEQFAGEVAAGLGDRPKCLPCRFLYDREGSRLFRLICRQPEYYPTRCERAILERHASQIAADVRGDAALAELGSGSSVKTRILIQALLSRFGRLRYVPIDISESALELSAPGLLGDYPELDLYPVAAEYGEGLRHVNARFGPPGLIAWLGSSVGNFDPRHAARFLRGIAEGMEPRDSLLMGVDLAKDGNALHRAYNDAAGVTAAFNKNLLARINRELGGEFDLDAFEHRAFFNEGESRIEMHLVSTTAQRVRIEKLDMDVSFEQGETIHTENSYKYRPEAIRALAREAGLRITQQWTDPDRMFSVNLLARD